MIFYIKFNVVNINYLLRVSAGQEMVHLALPAWHGTLPLSKGRNAFPISFALCKLTESHRQNKPLRFAKPLLGAYRLPLGNSQNPCALGRFTPSLIGSHQGASLLIGALRKIPRMLWTGCCELDPP